MECRQEPKCDEVKQLREEMPKLKEEIAKLKEEIERLHEVNTEYFNKLVRAQSVAQVFGWYIDNELPASNCPFRRSSVIDNVTCKSNDEYGLHHCEDCILNFVEGKPTTDER